MKRDFLTFLTLFFLTSLACAAPAWAPTATAEPTPNDPTQIIRNTPNALGTAQITAYQSVHVRREPMGLRIGYLYHGDVVILTGKCSDNPTGWAQIEWQGSVAWVRARYLSESECSEEK